jgi:hypothetical protein
MKKVLVCIFFSLGIYSCNEADLNNNNNGKYKIGETAYLYGNYKQVIIDNHYSNGQYCVKLTDGASDSYYIIVNENELNKVNYPNKDSF